MHLQRAKKLAASFGQKSGEFSHRKVVFFVCLVFVLTIVGPNLLGIEKKVDAAISVRNSGIGTTAATGATATNTLTISTPTGTIEGDVLIANLGVYGSTTMTTPAGWQVIAETGSGTGSTDVRMWSFSRVATVNEPTSHTFQTQHNRQIAGGITAYSGVETTLVSGVMQPMFDCNTATASSATGTTSLRVNGSNTCSSSTTTSMVVGAFSVNTETSITPPTGMAERFDRFSGDLLAADVTIEAASGLNTSGSVGEKIATSGASGRYAAHLFTLKEAVHKFDLAGYRWYTNVNSIDFVGISDNVSGGPAPKLSCGAVTDRPLAVAHDESISSVYLAGFSGCNGEQWHIERRSTADGVPVDMFGDNGVITYDHTSTTTGQSDRAEAVAVDGSTSGYIYVAGYETVASGTLSELNTRWRIMKLSKTNGALVSGFGTGGVITRDLGQGNGKNDYATALFLDTTNNALYIAGEDSSPSVDGTQWRIEKRNATTGALCDGSLVDGSPICIDGQFGSGGVVTSNPSTGNDKPSAISIDVDYGYIYISGQQNLGNDPQWRVEKRNAVTGALCTSTSACSEGAFNGTNGFFNSNPTKNSSVAEPLYAVEVEVKSGTEKYVYLGGSDKSGGNLQWRMEKLNAITGVLVSGFASSGVYIVNPDGKEDDAIVSFAVDKRYDHLYIVGTDGGNMGGSSRDFRWRVQKHNSINGALCDGSSPGGVPVCGTYSYVDGNGQTQTTAFPAFGGENGDALGVATSNPIVHVDSTTPDNDQATDMVIFKQSPTSADGALYIIGFDRGEDTTGTGDTQWRMEKRNLLDGTRQFDMETLAARNVAARPQKVNMQIRLRFLLHLQPASIYMTDPLPVFKLQYAPKVGTCDASFDGEEGFFEDVSETTGKIQWNDNSTAADGDMPRDLRTDPWYPNTDPGYYTNIVQGYEESNPINVRRKQAAGQNGLWDIALRDIEAFGSFCFRVVHGPGSTYPEGTRLDQSGGAYSYVPEINLCLNPPTEVLMRHGSYFCGNIENPFFWSQHLEF